MSHSESEYVLGTTDAELARLGLQHRLWSREAFALWERAGIGPGAHVLDVGCGPGHAAFDLSQLVTHSGRVTAVDESQRFIRYLAAQAEARGVINVHATLQDVQALQLEPQSADFAFARWVLCFTPEPEKVVSGVAKTLKPGGCFLIQDYVNWRGLLVSPPGESFAEVKEITDRAWRESGGDPAVGMRLPAMLAENGFKVEFVRPLQKVARPRDPLWQWPTTFFANWLPSLVERGQLRPQLQDAFMEEWARCSSDPNAFFWTPPMVEIVARRD